MKKINIFGLAIVLISFFIMHIKWDKANPYNKFNIIIGVILGIYFTTKVIMDYRSSKGFKIEKPEEDNEKND